MKSKIKTNSGKVFSARKTSIFFSILLIFVFAISYSCKKNNPTENPPTQLRDTQTSTNAVIGALGDSNYYKQNVVISFNGRVDSISAVDGDGNAVEGITYDSSTGIVNFDAITNSEGLKASGNVSNYTLTFSVAGETNGTFQIPVTLRKANIIANEDTTANGRNLSNAIYTTDLYNVTDKPNFKFGNSESKFDNSQITFTNTANNSSATNMSAEIITTITDNIKKGGNFSKYFSDLVINFDSNAIDKKSAYYKAVFSLHFTNEMTNANGYRIQFKGNGDKELTDERGRN